LELDEAAAPITAVVQGARYHGVELDREALGLARLRLASPSHPGGMAEGGRPVDPGEQNNLLAHGPVVVKPAWPKLTKFFATFCKK
jgi:hypothetical protein